MPDTLTPEQAEIARLVRVIEGEIASWERTADDADPDDPGEQDYRNYARGRAEDLREELASTAEAGELAALVQGADERIQKAQTAQYQAERDLLRYREAAAKLERFAGWLKTAFGDLFDVERLVEAPLVGGREAVVVYTNWKGETAERRIVPGLIWFGVTQYHRTPGFLLRAFDVEKGAVRDFALKDVREWREASEQP